MLTSESVMLAVPALDMSFSLKFTFSISVSAPGSMLPEPIWIDPGVVMEINPPAVIATPAPAPIPTAPPAASVNAAAA